MTSTMPDLVLRSLQRALREARPAKLLASAVVFAAVILGPMALGACGCTMFTLASVCLVLAGALGVGNAAFGALTIEREKKTLDSLRLTQLTAHEILLAKIAPEWGRLLAGLLVMGPTVLAAGHLSGADLGTVLVVFIHATLAGVFAAVLGIFVSSLSTTTSQAVVAGWISKGAWLLVLPLLDILAGAVLVQRVSPPVFSCLDPLAALGVLLVPEGAEGTRLALPWLYPLATLIAVVAMWRTAAWRFSTGMQTGGGLEGEHTSRVYRSGFGPRWLGNLFPTLRSNPAFFRELTAQMRSGAGRWPGYLVFVVLFLAPTFYARSWTMKEMAVGPATGRTRQAVIVGSGSLPLAGRPGEQATPPEGICFHAPVPGGETSAILVGHTDTACLRTYLFQFAGVPLPASQLRFYRRVDASDVTSHRPGDEVPAMGTYVPVKTPDRAVASAFRLPSAPTPSRSLSSTTQDDVTRASLRVGLAGAIALFLLYLSVRYSAFLATSVTGDKARHTWEDLALTGIRVDEVLGGKMVGAIILPTLQMTAVFPLLLLFVVSGNITVTEVGALFVYALALSVAAATLGLWASAISTASQEAHLRALFLVLVAFFVWPVASGALQGPLTVGAVIGLCMAIGQRRSLTPWAAFLLALVVAPQALSPLTAAVSFMPSLTASTSYLSMLGVAPASGLQAVMNFTCGVLALLSLGWILWESALMRLADPRESGAVRASEELPRAS